MPGFILHAAAQVSCFHQIPATVPPGLSRVQVSANPVATVPKLPVGPGCPFQVPVPGGTKPQPCTHIEWANISTRVKVMGQPLLLQKPPGPGTGDGGCMSAAIPNGVPTVRLMQVRVSAM